MQGDMLATKTYTATEARRNFSDLFDAAHFGVRVLVRKRDRCVAIISMELMERVEKLLQIEAELEADTAQKALSEFQSKGGKSMDELAKELDMD